MKDQKILDKYEELVECLIKMVRVWHGMGMPKEQEERMWQIYSTMSPEMKGVLRFRSELASLRLQESQAKELSDEDIEKWADETTDNNMIQIDECKFCGEPFTISTAVFDHY